MKIAAFNRHVATALTIISPEFHKELIDILKGFKKVDDVKKLLDQYVKFPNASLYMTNHVVDSMVEGDYLIALTTNNLDTIVSSVVVTQPTKRMDKLWKDATE